MASIFNFLPGNAEYPASNFPQFSIDAQRRPILGFDAATKETCYWTAIAPQSLTGTLTAYIYYYMASATGGDVDVNVAVEAVTDGDAQDLDSASSFDTVNAVDNTSVPTTQGYIDVISVPLTNKDNIAAGDYFRISLDRDAADDTATGDMNVLGVEIRDGA